MDKQEELIYIREKRKDLMDKIKSLRMELKERRKQNKELRKQQHILRKELEMEGKKEKKPKEDLGDTINDISGE